MTTPAFVQAATASTSSATNSQSAAFVSSLTLNSLRIVALRLSGASDHVTAVSGSASGAYTRLTSIVNTAAGQRLYLYYKEGGASGAETVTVTTSTTSNSLRWGLLEYSGVLAAASSDVFAAAAYATSTTPATASITTTVNNDLVVALLSADADVTTIVPGGTENSRFTDGVSGNRFEGQDYLKATAGATTSSWTCGASQPGAYIIAAFFADTASAPSVVYPQYITRPNPLIRF